MLKVGLRRKWLGETFFCHLTSISKCDDATIQEYFIDFQRDYKAHAIFYSNKWSDFESIAVSIFCNFGMK